MFDQNVLNVSISLVIIKDTPLETLNVKHFLMDNGKPVWSIYDDLDE